METLEERTEVKKIPLPFLRMGMRSYFSVGGLKKGAAYAYEHSFSGEPTEDIFWKSDAGDYIVSVFNGTAGFDLVYRFTEDETGSRLRLTDGCAAVILANLLEMEKQTIPAILSSYRRRLNPKV